MKIELDRAQARKLRHDTRNAIEEFRWKMFEKTDRWETIGSSHVEYERWFNDLNFTFHGTLKGRKKPVIIDLMATPDALRSYFLEIQVEDQIGIAVSGTDKRLASFKEIDAGLGIQKINGNLTYPYTWRSIDAKLDGRPADLIVERGIGGMIFIPSHPAYYEYVMQRIWNMLSRNEGTFVADFHHLNKAIKAQFIPWARETNNHNLDLTIGRNGFKLVRHPESPNILPLPNLTNLE